MTCTATYTTTQATWIDGFDHQHRNRFRDAAGRPERRPRSASATILAQQTPIITLTKTANITSFSAPNTTVTYTYLVTNTGNVTLSPVSVTDPMSGLSPISCLGTTLAPGASTSCTATYNTTQGDLDRGTITNTGTAAGTTPDGTIATARSTVTIPAATSPGLSLVKSSDLSTFSNAGTQVIYNYLVTNTGNVTLAAVDVTDPMSGLSAINCPTSSLAPGASESCTASYTIRQADVDAGQITNTGTASGDPPSGPAVTDSSTLTITLSQAPTIAIAKSANITTYSAPNTAVTYSYLVTNAGNVTLHSVTVADPMAGLSAVSCPDSTLAPGASETCSATYTTTQTDVDRASITNTGTASGDPPSGPTVTDSATLVIPGAQSPGITMVKSANIASFSAPATTVTYSYLVTNTGNVTLTSVHVDDAMPNLSPISCSIAPLAPAASTTCTATYTTTQADVDRGSISNTATATGTAPLGPPPISGPSSVTIPATQTPGITIKKAGNPSGFSAAGSTIDYSYVVTNTGNVTLNPVTVNDPLPGLSPISCPSTQLAPDGLMTCTASYTTTQADVDAGGVTNTGTATGVPPAGPPVTDSATITIPASQQPNISLTKTASLTTYSAAGTPVTYDYQVTNTGNVTLDPVTVTDPMPGLSAITCSTNVLAPGGAETCTATYTTTQADMDHGSITNTGTASGTPPTGAAVVATSSVTLDRASDPGHHPAEVGQHQLF